MMKSDWLAASSFERTHEIVSAINTLSIHAKLALAGVDDVESEAQVQQARARLLTFLDQLGSSLHDVEKSQDGTIISADPRLEDLATRFLSAKRSMPQRSTLYALSLTELSDLVRSERPDDLRVLVPCLHDLRLLVEQHSHADVVGILGDM